MNNSNYVDFKCGLISGIVSNTICNPFDVIRVNIQLNNKISYNLKFLSRGLLPGFITIPTFWSIYFQSYENLKNINQYKLSFLNGYIASNIAATITCPLWFVRQKKNVNDNFNIILFYKNNGIMSFYRGLLVTYLINLSFIIQIPLYENLKNNDIIKNKICNDNLRILSITCISKTVAACVFYPIDTIRTIKRNNHNEHIIKIINRLNINPIKYYSGLNIYLIRSIPYHAITFCTFEYFKKRLK